MRSPRRLSLLRLKLVHGRSLVSLAGAVMFTALGLGAPAFSADTIREIDRSAVMLLDTPEPRQTQGDSQLKDQIEQGRYIVELLGCASCHTNGVMSGYPDSEKQLAGSSIGIALNSPLEQPRPAVVFPSNITPDMETGIGSRTDEELNLAIRHGIVPDAHEHTAVMPWPVYARLKSSDTRAIIAYLRSIEPVTHQVPEAIPQGRRRSAKYVYFGIYYSQKDWQPD